MSWQRWILLGIAVLALASGRRSLHLLAEQLPGSALGSLQAFDVHLTLAAPFRAQGGTPAAACAPSQQQRLEQMQFQFLLQTAASTPTLSVAPSNLATPTLARGDTVPLQADDSSFRFAGTLELRAGLDSIAISRGGLHLTASQGGAAAAGLAVDHVHVSFGTLQGDVENVCDSDATGAGVPDTTPPVGSFPNPCSGTTAGGCKLLADGAVTVTFSKPVLLADVASRLTATADDGAAVALFPPLVTESVGYRLRVQGAWPLGSAITLGLAPGVRDLAGNASASPSEQAFTVVADPGELAAANNAGFEAGDLSGYSVLSLVRGVEPDPVYEPEAFGLPASPAPAIVSSFQGITPTDGQWMLQAGRLSGCGDAIVLTTRLEVPAGAAALVLDDDAVITPPASPGHSGLLLDASLRSDSGIVTAQLQWPEAGSLLPADAGALQTGWSQLSLDVENLAGRSVILTLRLRPVSGRSQSPELPCVGGILLLDNLRFA